MHHTGAIATTLITISIMILTQAQHDIPFVSTWLVSTAIPNVMTILGILKELEIGGIGSIKVNQITDTVTTLQNIKNSLAVLESQLKP